MIPVMGATRRVEAHRAGESAGLLAAVGRLVSDQLAAALRSNGLRALHLASLAELRAGPRSQQALGEVTGADPVRLVGVLNDLEAEGLVSRRRDPLDRRRHIVEVSDLGRARLAATENAIAAAEERLLAKLGPAERDQLEILLSAIVEAGDLEVSCKAAIKADEDGSGAPACEE
jgi:MarR family transcriptional regulator, lower aerobic nicotinate degradation pathway regulator